MMPATAVKDQIPHTWPLFFAQYGRFTPIQEQAIPPILDGQDVVVMAATASGKTEAVLAPLLERYWPALRPPTRPRLQILYICPTRALVRDLYERLRHPLQSADIQAAMKTGDTGPVNTRRPSSLLLTTPESTDALLTRVPHLFADLRAIVLDEIHLLDNSPRGDQLRCLLARLARIRQYARPDGTPTQRIALSATIQDPEGVAQRYLQNGTVIQSTGGRPIFAEVKPLYDMRELTNALAVRKRQKSLIFCNSRAEVERTAAYLRRHLPYHAEVFVHYSNLDGAFRQEVEARFAAASVAICVSTSTLELGVDIGSVNDVVLLGVPPDLASFTQRAGRGRRRSAQAHVLCMPKSPREWARFEALQYLATEQDTTLMDVRVYGFRPSVLVQQIFSLIKQSPTGSVRLADLRRLAPPEIADAQVRQLLAELTMHGYLQTGRLGEWKPGAALQKLIDQHDIYSNIGVSPLAATAVDAHTGRVIAQTERVYQPGTVVMFGGRAMKVLWRDQKRFGLAPAPHGEVDEVLRFQKSYAAIPFIVTQAVARLLGVGPRRMTMLPNEQGQYLFHFWGTVWGELLAAWLREQNLRAEAINEYCLLTEHALTRLPTWDERVGQLVARKTVVSIADRLEMGRFHRLLPPQLAVTAAANQLNLPRFALMYQSTTIHDGANIREKLYLLAE